MPITGKNHLVYQVAEAIRPAHHVAVSPIGTNCLMEIMEHLSSIQVCSPTHVNSVLYFRNPDDSPSPAQHCPVQSSAAQYSLVPPSTV